MKTILVDAVNTFVSDEGVINEELYALLEGFENPKMIVTNAPLDLFEKFGLDNVPYPVFSLYNNPSKKDPKFYEIMLEEKNWSTESVVYFEHNIEAVESARSVGLIVHHFEKGKQDLQKLKIFLAENL